MATITELRDEAKTADDELEQDAGGSFDEGPQSVHDGDEPEVGGKPAFDEFDGPQGVLAGFEELVGGKEPTTHKVRLYGGAIEVEPPEGGFEKGGAYVLRVEVRCHKAGFTDETDAKTGQVVGCSDERGLKITGVSVIE